MIIIKLSGVIRRIERFCAAVWDSLARALSPILNNGILCLLEMSRCRSLKVEQPMHAIWIYDSNIHFLLAYTCSGSGGYSSFYYKQNAGCPAIVDRYEIPKIKSNFIAISMQLVSCVFKGENPQIYVPHISPVLFSTPLRDLLWRLHRYGYLRFYDDGITCLSKSTRLHDVGYVPKEETVLSWDYSFLDAGDARVVDICQSMSNKCYDVICRNINNLSDGSVIIISSKWMHYDGIIEDFLLKNQDNPNRASVCYIPHYVQLKNNGLIMKLAVPLSFEVLELDLPPFLNDTMTIVSGVTSTLLYFLELMSRGYIPNCKVLFYGDPVAAGKYIGEYNDFLSALSFYDACKIDIRSFHG